MALPLYGCRSCAVHDAIVFCLCCDARLCLYCDTAVHGATAAAAVHPRAPLCDACGAAPAALRCDGTVTLCAVCVGRGAPGVTRTGVATYTGCPGPAEMVRLISVDPPQPQQDFETWLADKLPRPIEEYEQDHHQLPPDWDVAMETARLEKMLADCYTEPEPSSYGNSKQLLSSSPAGSCQQQAQASATATVVSATPSSYGNGNGLLSSSPAGSCQQQQQAQAAAAAATVVSAVQPSWQNNNDAGFPFCNAVLPESEDFMQAAQAAKMTTDADYDNQVAQDASAAMAKKREARERAKLRYEEKKKNRRFCKQILYASRKARADTRKRVNGRFAKASASTSPHAAQTDEHPTTATAKRETSS